VVLVADVAGHGHPAELGALVDPLLAAQVDAVAGAVEDLSRAGIHRNRGQQLFIAVGRNSACATVVDQDRRYRRTPALHLHAAGRVDVFTRQVGEGAFTDVIVAERPGEADAAAEPRNGDRGIGGAAAADRQKFLRWLAVPLFLALLGEVYYVVRTVNNPPPQIPATGTAPPVEILGTVESIGREMFTSYLLPFEATSVLILMAIVGAMLLARREKASDVIETQATTTEPEEEPVISGMGR